MVGLSCPYCRYFGSNILSSMLVRPSIRKRRHECMGCSGRFTSLNNLLAIVSGANKIQYQIALYNLKGTKDAA